MFNHTSGISEMRPTGPDKLSRQSSYGPQKLPREAGRQGPRRLTRQVSMGTRQFTRRLSTMSIAIQDNMSITVAIAPIFGFFGRVGTNVWYSVILLLAVIIYICGGALAFQKFETGESYYNITAKKEIRKMMLQAFTMDVWYGGWNGSVLTQEDWDLLHTISGDRCFKADSRDARGSYWNYWTSLDFCSTILTTIGYGGMVPHTTTGKLAVILYAIPGMLLMMSYLNLFSQLVLLVIRYILKGIESWLNLCRRIFNLGRRKKKLASFTVSIILAVVSLLMLTCYLGIMSWRLSDSSPNDSFLKALYFYVITMTTVGLGDIAVIDHKGINVCVKVLLAFCIGLALVTTVFGAMRGLAEANRKRVVKATKILAEKAKKAQQELKKRRESKNPAGTGALLSHSEEEPLVQVRL